MARKRNSENEIVVSATTPARHKTAASPRTRRPAAPVATAPAIEPAAVAPEAAAYAPTHDEIAALAYSYWEARGYQGGCPSEDWTRAESELRASRTVAIAHA